VARHTALTFRKEHSTYLTALCLAKEPIGCRSGRTVGDPATNHWATAISLEGTSNYLLYTFTKDQVFISRYINAFEPGKSNRAGFSSNVHCWLTAQAPMLEIMQDAQLSYMKQCCGNAEAQCERSAAGPQLAVYVHTVVQYYSSTVL